MARPGIAHLFRTADRHAALVTCVSGSGRDDQLVKVTVTDDQVSQPSSVDVSALRCQHEQGRVYPQFLLPVALITGGVLQTRPGSRVHLLTMSDRDVADIR
jgi:hypothetical protein